MTDPKPFVIPPDLPADVMQYERGWNACLEALAASHRERSAQPADKPAGQAVTDSVDSFCDASLDAGYGYPAGGLSGSNDLFLYQRDADRYAGWKLALAALRVSPEPATAGDDPGEFGAGIRHNPKARYWQERAQFWRSRAIELGWREHRDAENGERATPAAAVPDGLIEAVRRQRQIDESGDEIGVSRQAVDEAATILESLAAAPNRPADAQRGVPARWNGDDVEKAVHVLTILHNDSATECDKDGRAELAAVHRDAVSLLEYTLELHREHQSTLAASPADPLPASEVSP